LQCYKSVCFDLEKASKKVHKKQRLNVLYIISDICRRSKARLGSKDRYGMTAPFDVGDTDVHSDKGCIGLARHLSVL